MPHLDEGIIHAWLDGALTDEERASAEAHAAGCATCSAAVAEARGLVAASSRILSALDDVPAGVIPVATSNSGITATTVGARKESHARRWTTRPLLRAAAAVLFVATGTFFVASREEAKREVILASDKSESTHSVVGPDTVASDLAVLEQAMPPAKVRPTAPAPARRRVDTGSSSTAVMADAAGTTKATNTPSDTIRSVLAEVAVAAAGVTAPAARVAANQAAMDSGAERRAMDGSRREAPRIARQGSITELRAKEAESPAALASPAFAKRDASALGRLAGCYEIRMGTWTPAVTLGADTVYITPPRSIVLDTLPAAAAPSRSSGFRVRPVLDTPGRDDARWFALGVDSLRVSWTTGLNGLTMHLKLENQTLSGIATTFWSFDRRSQQSAVTGRRIECK